MKTSQLIEQYKIFTSATQELFSVQPEYIGPASLKGKDFETEQTPFRKAKGVYLAADAEDNVLYIGMSEKNSIGHRIFKLIEKVSNGMTKNEVVLSHVYGVVLVDEVYASLYEKVGLSLFVKSEGSRPSLNKII